MSKKRKIPFWLMPGSWGLKGQTRKRAELEYYYDGEELQKKLLELELQEEKDEKKRKIIILNHDLKNNKITPYEYKNKILKLEYDLLDDDDENEQNRKKNSNDINDEYRLKKLEIDLQYGKINKREYDKQRADILGIPWVDVSPETRYDPSQKQNGFYLVLDYNKHFVNMLIENGYGNRGKTEQEIVDTWFKDVIYGILLEDDNNILNQ